MAKIQYNDKQQGAASPLAEEQKFTHGNANEVKNAVNYLHDEIEFDGTRPITAQGDLNGKVPGGSTVKQTLEGLLYPSEPPTAALTLTLDGNTSGSTVTKEFDAGSTENAVANWTAGRQGSTTEISSVKVDGQAQAYNQPAQGADTSGTSALTFPSNGDKTVQLIVETVDGKTASDSVAVRYRWKLYLGFVTSATPGDGDLQGLSDPFGSSLGYSGSIGHPDGSSQLYFAIAFPLTWEPADGATVVLGGFDVSSSFNRSTRAVINASGGSTDYVILTSQNTTAGDYNNLEIS